MLLWAPGTFDLTLFNILNISISEFRQFFFCGRSIEGKLRLIVSIDDRMGIKMLKVWAYPGRSKKLCRSRGRGRGRGFSAPVELTPVQRFLKFCKSFRKHHAKTCEKHRWIVEKTFCKFLQKCVQLLKVIAKLEKLLDWGSYELSKPIWKDFTMSFKTNKLIFQ